MAAVVAAERRWECPLCPQKSVTRSSEVQTQMHHCVALGGLMVPMVIAGTRCKIEVIERQDYVGGDLVQLDDSGRPVMSVKVTRDDGNDCVIYAPAAIAAGR